MRLTDNYKITDVFGINVFSEDVMRKYMGDEAFFELKNVIDNDKVLQVELADKVGEAMKNWAMQNGATHYTHWFQPLTGTTAEKHDSFIAIDKKGNTILQFSGKNLLKGETDASSFPSGGIRATFEARGYTVWDVSSPAFIKKDKDGASILYIPTAFCSYNGEALDKKTPLLRSMRALNRESLRLLRLLGDNETANVSANVGGEQEYFLINQQDFNARTDLKFCGRTLFGCMPPKGQEQNDQYYGVIKKRVSVFMADLNEELWKLGVTAKTQHNEVAPAQHEFAPIFCTANIATDQNQLIMDTMKKIATEHGFACLLHEKPFQGVNGSGKHNNWSLATDRGKNLLSPGKNPGENIQFLLFFTAVISAVDEYADLVRMSAATPGNEFRMGAHEAPPTTISVYIGEDMTDMLDKIEKGERVNLSKQYLQSGISYLAELYKDTSDRNRTSPFAFTGNKFEFRMVGASATLSNPNTILNTITAEMLARISDRLEAKAKEKPLDEAVWEILREMYKKHKRVIYNGNNYSKEWTKEAKRRGLCQISNCVEAYDTLVQPKNIELFERHQVLSKTELTLRREIYLDTYVKTFSTEAQTMLLMSRQEIMPAIMRVQAELAKSVIVLKQVNESYGRVQEELLSKLNAVCETIGYQQALLKQAYSTAQRSQDSKKQAILFRDQVLPAMNELRNAVDKAEELIPKDQWFAPGYADILFYSE